MVKWIRDARAAEMTEMDDKADEILTESVQLVRNAEHAAKWKPIALAVLFGGLKQCPS